MGLKIYGIALAENEDNAGEKILLDGADISRLHGVRDEHGDDTMFHKVGGITFSKKIYSEKDCEDYKQLRCWRSCQVPFVYIEAELADDTDHPNAKSAAELIKFSQRDDIPFDIGFSVDGGIMERRMPDGSVTEDKEHGKILSKTLALEAALTTKPCNPKCKIWLENDLTKSDIAAPAPKNLPELLAKSQAAHSFNERHDAKLFIKLETLKKSLVDYFSAFTDMKCHHCSKPVRFFKSTNSMPNKCEKCGKSFTMSALWKAMNK